MTPSVTPSVPHAYAGTELEQSSIRKILQDSLCATACKSLHGSSHGHLAIFEQTLWLANEAAAICMLLGFVGLIYDYCERVRKFVSSTFTGQS